jgi:hypothetical protein
LKLGLKLLGMLQLSKLQKQPYHPSLGLQLLDPLQAILKLQALLNRIGNISNLLQFGLQEIKSQTQIETISIF